MIERQLGDDNITKNIEESEKSNEKECPKRGLEELFAGLMQMLSREIQMRNQKHEERELDSEQNAYMEKMFTCEFVYSNL